MGIEKLSKIQKILQSWPPGTVSTAAWFSSKGVSPQLLKKYATNQWITAIGHGAYFKTGESIKWPGAVYALQTQQGLDVHVGALSALSLHGFAHFLRSHRAPIFLFSPPKTHLPTWCQHGSWEAPLVHTKTAFLGAHSGLTDKSMGAFSVQLSTAERAILECLYLSPAKIDLIECHELMQGLSHLRPSVLQALLEECTSVKVKRLFLYLASKTGHEWAKRINIRRLSLGSGVRTIAKGGVYIASFELIVPKPLADP